MDEDTGTEGTGEDLRPTTIAGRLRLAKDDRSWPAIAKEAQVSQNTMERLLYSQRMSERPDQRGDLRGEGKRGPTLDVIGRLARALNVRAGWLAFGDEAMR